MNTKILLTTICVAVLFLASVDRLSAAPRSMSRPMPAQATTASPAGGATAPVRIEGAWVRAAPPGATMMAGYMVVHNNRKTPLRLVSAQSDAFGMVELHRSLIVNGIDTMRAAGVQTIPAGGALKIAPGGLHLMLMQPTHALKIGDSVRFRLNFADGSSTDVVAPVSMQAPGVPVR